MNLVHHEFLKEENQWLSKWTTRRYQTLFNNIILWYYEGTMGYYLNIMSRISFSFLALQFLHSFVFCPFSRQVSSFLILPFFYLLFSSFLLLLFFHFILGIPATTFFFNFFLDALTATFFFKLFLAAATDRFCFLFTYTWYNWEIIVQTIWMLLLNVYYLNYIVIAAKPGIFKIYY